MFVQYYEIEFNNEAYLNLTNVYKHLYIENASSSYFDVYYRNILIVSLSPFTSVTLENVFSRIKDNKQFDENVQLKFISNGTGIAKIINYGA